MEHSLEDDLIKQLNTCYIYTILSDDLILFYDKNIEYFGKESLTKYINGESTSKVKEPVQTRRDIYRGQDRVRT